jgi:hypothetical protein
LSAARRALKAIPRLADANPGDFEPVVWRWHGLGLARGVIGSEPFEETWIDFLRGWPKVRFPKGSEPMTAIYERAKRLPVPQAAQRYELPGLRLLAALCQELQRASGDKPFFLACRTAGKLLGVDHTTAWRWLFLLAHDNLITEVEKGDRARRRASRYRWLGGDVAPLLAGNRPLYPLFSTDFGVRGIPLTGAATTCSSWGYGGLSPNAAGIRGPFFHGRSQPRLPFPPTLAPRLLVSPLRA